MKNAKFCNDCGSVLNPDAHFCTQCGAKSNDGEQPVAGEKKAIPEIQSPKSAVTALLLCIFLGTLGVHRFYVGKIGTGILMLFTGGGLGFWTLIDIISIACCEFKDKQDRPLIFVGGRTSPSKVKWIVGGVFAAIILFVTVIIAIVFYATSGVTDLVKDQLIAIRAGDLKKAYSYTAKDFQNEVSFDRFERFVNQYPSLKNNKTSSFTERKIENGKGTIKGTLQSNDGTTVPVEYILIKEGDIWKILVIHILPTEVGAGSDQSSNNAVTLPDVFDDKDNKFSIHYPSDWEHQQPDKTSVTFRGKKGTASFDSIVAIQTIHIKKAVHSNKIIKVAVNALKKQITTKASDVKFLSEGSVQLPRNPKKIEGTHFIVTYTYKTKQLKKMQVIFMSVDGLNLYSWGFTSPVQQFPNDLPVVKAMFESWTID